MSAKTADYRSREPWHRCPKAAKGRGSTKGKRSRKAAERIFPLIYRGCQKGDVYHTLKYY
jgi:hypothetical protein